MIASLTDSMTGQLQKLKDDLGRGNDNIASHSKKLDSILDQLQIQLKDSQSAWKQQKEINDLASASSFQQSKKINEILHDLDRLQNEKAD